MHIWPTQRACRNAYGRAVSHVQISKKWKLLSVEQQQQELEAKRKAKQEAKDQAKLATGNRCTCVSPELENKVWLFVFTNAVMCRGAKESQTELPGVSPERRHCSAASSGESRYFVGAAAGRL